MHSLVLLHRENTETLNQGRIAWLIEEGPGVVARGVLGRQQC